LLADLGIAPPSNALLSPDTSEESEIRLPLRVLVCESCWLVQTEDHVTSAELFNTSYPYFSGFSRSWIEHCRAYVDDVIDRVELTPGSHVVEIGANDGSLLEHVISRGIKCTGVEPTAGPAAAAREKGIPIIQDFFGVELARKMASDGMDADAMIAANVLAHVPDVNDFVAGFAELLKPEGIASFEFPHLLNLVEQNQFDTIYHEHFSYLSLAVVDRILAHNGLHVFDVSKQPTHGGSLRVFAQRNEGSRARMPAVDDLLREEERAGVRSQAFYCGFQSRIEKIRTDFLSFLFEAKQAGKTVGGYGAAAKANTLLNFAGIKSDLVSWIVDRNPAKQGMLMPGSRIPIVPEEWLPRARPEFVILFPWNLETEIMEQLQYIRSWGGKFVVALPQLRIIE
jgi:2-polyprenyl-3-methyl-5-hydroxy-6-metoxy-1,4-benzoquinol methylase